MDAPNVREIVSVDTATQIIFSVAKPSLDAKLTG